MGDERMVADLGQGSEQNWVQLLAFLWRKRWEGWIHRKLGAWRGVRRFVHCLVLSSFLSFLPFFILSSFLQSLLAFLKRARRGIQTHVAPCQGMNQAACRQSRVHENSRKEAHEWKTDHGRVEHQCRCEEEGGERAFAPPSEPPFRAS